MKALPLWQPWASLVAIGAKRIETRHWEAPDWLIGRRVAIHATKTEREMPIANTEPFRRHLQEAGADGRLVLVDGRLPFGALIATVVLDRCRRMTAEGIAELEERDPDERAFGNYSTARYAWVLRDVERFAVPIPFTGRQGIFDVPDALVGWAPQEAVAR